MQFDKKSMSALNRLSESDYQVAEKPELVIVLDNIRSMNNIGSVFRTADGFRIQSIYLCGYTAAPPHRDIHKTALGATETVDWKKMDIQSAIAELRLAGYEILALEQTSNSIDLKTRQFKKGEKLAIILGNEVEGVSDAALALCDGTLEITQFGSKHSFNISVAAGIVLWQLLGQYKYD